MGSVTVLHAQPVTSSLAFHTFGWGYGRLDAGPETRSARPGFWIEPLFLTMSEVGEATFGTLELDMLMRAATHWAYRLAYDSHDRPGLDHAYVTLSKGVFLLHEGRGGPFDWGLGVDFDWRRAAAAPETEASAAQARTWLGMGIVTRFKFAWGKHVLLSPALAYDLYGLPRPPEGYLAGHGLRLDGDMWLGRSEGGYALSLQPFWHWRRREGRLPQGGRGDITASTWGLKFGVGKRP